MDAMVTVSFTEYEALKAENARLRKMLQINLSLKGPLRRQWWITEQINRRGTINRGDIVRTFGVGYVQASIDLTRWQKNNKNVIEYNKSTKRYERIR